MDRQELYLYKQMPKWTKNTVPEAFLSKHNAVEGIWEHITVMKGRPKFYKLDEKGMVWEEYELSPEDGTWIIAPQQWYKTEPLDDDLEMQFEFYRTAGDYFSKKYGMSATHSAVHTAKGIMPAGKMLDMGCGQGRNVLFLTLKGFDMTTVNNNSRAIQDVAELARAEGLPVRAFEYDLSVAHLQDDFGYIVAIVVFIFLRPRFVPWIIADMQAYTNPGDYNLIVPAVDTADFPYPMSFPFKLGEGELHGYYQDWQLVEHRGELGSMYARDEAGDPIQFKFVTVLAEKSE